MTLLWIEKKVRLQWKVKKVIEGENVIGKRLGHGR